MDQRIQRPCDCAFCCEVSLVLCISHFMIPTPSWPSCSNGWRTRVSKMRYMDGGRRRLEGEHPGCVAHKPPRCSAVVVARSGASLPREGRRTGAVVVVAVGRARRRGGKRGGGRRKEEDGSAHRLVHAAVVVLRGAHRSREKLRCRRGIVHRQGHTLRRVWPPGLRRRRGCPGIRDGSMLIESCCGAGDGNGLRRRICCSRVHGNLKRA